MSDKLFVYFMNVDFNKLFYIESACGSAFK